MSAISDLVACVLAIGVAESSDDSDIDAGVVLECDVENVALLRANVLRSNVLAGTMHRSPAGYQSFFA